MDGAQLQEGPPHRQDYARNRKHSHPTSSVCFSVSVFFIPSFSKDCLSDFLDHSRRTYGYRFSQRETDTHSSSLSHILWTGNLLGCLSGVLLWFSELSPWASGQHLGQIALRNLICRRISRMEGEHFGKGRQSGRCAPCWGCDEVPQYN